LLFYSDSIEDSLLFVPYRSVFAMAFLGGRGSRIERDDALVGQTPSLELVVFALDGQSYAVELITVQRVAHAIEVTPLPHAPQVILGVINVQGYLMAVVNLRHRFGLPERKIDPQDQFVIVDTPTRRVALVVDAVIGIRAVPRQGILSGKEITSELHSVQGIAKLADDLIFIQDLDQCLSLQEERMLDDALEQRARITNG
jgi:purine-binding chemotaxis protein CheW